jgi:hypothetical protein
MKTEGQAWALGQLADIVQASGGTLETVEIIEPTAEGGEISVSLSVDCSLYAKQPGGIPFKDRERLLVIVPPNFPLAIPRTFFSHKRYGAYPHVQWGSYICLYQSPDTEWQPEDGLYGLLQRVDDWLRAAAANNLDPIGMPLHPPVTYSTSSLKIVPTQNTPTPDGAFWAGYAKITHENDSRIELGEWIHYDAEVPAGRLAAAILMPAGMPHEYPTTMSQLLKLLEERNVSQDVVRIVMNLCALHTNEGEPLTLILGAAMRGTAGGTRLQHLAGWQIDPQRAEEIRKAVMAKSDGNPIDVLEFSAWAANAPIQWCSVLEDRPEIVTRRDTETPAEAWKGLHVVVLGCGAIGSAVAMLLARAGVAKLTLYDRDVVKPGILVRQLFDRYQIGVNKAKAAAKNVQFVNPAAEALHSSADVVRLLDNNERRAIILAADVVVNATASHMVATALERAFRAWPTKHPPILSMALGHRADQALLTMSVDQAPGVTLDIDRRCKIAIANLAHGKHVLDEFWPTSPERTRLFQPEPGCSSPTFRGSAADVLALTARMMNAASEWLTNPTIALRARSFDMTGPHGGAAREFEFSWPADSILPDGRNGYQIRVSQAALSGVFAWVRSSTRTRGRRVETGGLLFGHVDEFLKIIWVDEISGPPPDSVHSASAFVCGTAGVAELNEEKEKRTRKSVSFVGMWHTHPLDLPRPSSTDYSAMAKLLTGNAFEAKRFLMMIIGEDASTPLISGTVFERSDYQH